MRRKPRIIYHRGRHGLVGGREIRENTIEAFEAAAAEGAPMIEFDVWTGLRVAHDPGRNAASPTLKQALAAIRGRAGVNIEVKSPRALERTIAAVRFALDSGVWIPEQFVLSSFHHASAAEAKRLLPEVRVGVINDGVLEATYLEWLRDRNIDNLHIEWMNVYMDREAGYPFRDEARRLGFAIWVWTVNSEAVFNAAAAYGADAVFTDRPDLFRP